MISKIMRVAMVATLALTLAGTTAASAKPGDVVKSGSCSGASNWKLKLSPEDGKTQVEFEVDSNHVGQRWQVRITKNGSQIFKGPRTTKGPSGSFTVRKVTSDPAGTDVFRGRATNAATGETCTGTASI
jgi:hypothetical protein